MPLKQWVEMAFSVSDYGLKSPGWLEGARFNLDAKLPVAKSIDQESVSEMLRSLLIERFALKWHVERQDVSGYELIIGKKLLLKPSDVKDHPQKGGRSRGPALIGGRNMPISELAVALGEVLGRPVVDATHLSGGFDVNLRWRPDDAAGLADAQRRRMPDLENLPSLFTAVQEELGLRLQRGRVPFDIIVIDNIDRQPTEN